MSEITNFATTGAASAGVGNNKKRTRRNIDERMQEAQKKADLYAARLQRERAKIARLSAQSTKRTRHLEIDELMPLGRVLFEALKRLEHDVDGTQRVCGSVNGMMRMTHDKRVLWLYKILREWTVRANGNENAFTIPVPTEKDFAEWHKQCEADRARRAAEKAMKNGVTGGGK